LLWKNDLNFGHNRLVAVIASYYKQKSCKNHAKFDNNEILISWCPSINEDFCSRSRHAKKITAGI
jgi:hypothetical protein